MVVEGGTLAQTKERANRKPGHSVDSRRKAVIAYGLFVNDSAARRKPP